VGEGAPGADGSRRWRGRRGRRRGRGDGSESPQAQEAQTPEVLPEAAAVEPRYEERTREDRGPREDRGGRNGRGDRGGRNDRGDRGGRDRFAARPERESSERESNGPQPEPFILPGESLSKYRRGEDASQEPAAAKPVPVNTTFVTATPSTAVDLGAGWDGGFVLPGETLSRRGGGESRGGGRDREVREERPVRRELEPSEAVQPAVTSQHEPEPFELTPLAVPADSGELFDTYTYTESEDDQPAETVPVVEEEMEEQVELAPAEYEPEEDTAVSFRVDPAAPSEFRHSAFAEPEAEEQPKAAEPEVAAEVHEPVFVAVEEDAYVEHVAETAPVHEFTAVQPTGEMLSAPAEPAAERHVEEHAAAPIAHEAAVQSVTLHEAEVAPTATVATPVFGQGFAPGEGELEEEVLDDEDGDYLPTHHARSDHDDMEEETLEGAADLGSMIQEMSIDKITGPEAGDDEDDFDIDEEDLDHDEFDNGAQSERCDSV